MDQQINEELRQYKLFKIQETEAKLRRFWQTYLEVKEGIFIKFSKNVTSNILQIPIILLFLICLVIGILLLFPDIIIDLVTSNEIDLSRSDKEEFLLISEFTAYLLLGLSGLFGFISYLLKLNNRKRNNIYNLSKLLEEVMLYMEDSSNDEKRKYEYFVDSIAEKEKIKRSSVHNMG
ncbi:hypothetical protein OQ279_05300 [Salinimicrobium sp. MT39]|uniref:Uncharacterized protein n=1 Tax=Salinimicrobium profundisediminis TaxID=2994553 RepID=A0A9X3I0L5_9FLAO|nr:hypothetical protein [Salinimicrobium profundisediminis]MCX2837563.1 hypothetical protein [Salinimicrobium profundisediminis]